MKNKLLLLGSFVSALSFSQNSNPIDLYLNGNPVKTIIAGQAQGVLTPRDLDFHPSKDELWVVLMETENTGGKTALIKKPGKTGQTTTIQKDLNAWHFLSLPTAIAFSPNQGAPNNNFATSPGVFDCNHNGGAPFTGPTLWSSDPMIYAQDPGAGLNGSHIDMLHESPYSMGICADTNNIFWLNDGYHNTVVRYDFKADHGPGASYHGDGVIRQYSGLALVEDTNHFVVSHLVLDKVSRWLYIADTGKKRIVRLKTNTGSKSSNLTPYETPMAEYANYTGYSSNTFVNTGLLEPSGIDIYGNRLIVSDYATGEIIIYSITTATTGTELGRIQTNAGGIMGIKVSSDGKIWYVDAINNQVIKLTPSGGTTSVSEPVVDNHIQIYPNPVAGNFINFTGLSQANTFLKIYNSIGQVVLESIVNIGNARVDVSTLGKGTFFVSIVNTELNINTTKKLVVIK